MISQSTPAIIIWLITKTVKVAFATYQAATAKLFAVCWTEQGWQWYLKV
jgi:hypothetical protein